MPHDIAQRLLSEFEAGRDGILRVTSHMRAVDSASAVATVKADETKVKQLIRSTVGFDTVNQQVVNFMMSWVGTEVQHYMKAVVSAEGHRRIPMSNDVRPKECSPDVDILPV